MKHFQSDNFSDIYVAILKSLRENPDFTNIPSRTGNSNESLGLSFVLTNPMNRKIDYEARGVRKEFYEKFFSWILSGSDDISSLLEWNPRAAEYMAGGELPANFSTNYGPRIKDQLNEVIHELVNVEYSRRASICILKSEDNLLYRVESKAEYPCTFGTQYFLRRNSENQLELHAITHMRSNNMFTTACYDVYNFTRLQETIANLLTEKFSQSEFPEEVKLGSYHHLIGSAHIFERDFERIDAVLREAKM